jgi:BirA family biotin operon repressor/biotin-[acetyl-CoA-carboxylase] ligase
VADRDRDRAEDGTGSAGAVPSDRGVWGAISGPPTSVIRVDAVDSTQSVAFALAAEGAPDNTVVVADYQREGRGRSGRAWLAAPGTALLASIIVRPRLAPRELPLYSFVAAVATADAIEGLAHVQPRLKWPNDVLVGGKKIAGILLESRTMAPNEPVMAIGIGINVRQATFPADLDARATSLRIASGREIAIDDVRIALLEALAAWRAQLERDGFAPVRTRWLALADTIGRRVHVDGIAGTAVDLASDGALVIADGPTRRRVVAGDIGWQSEPLDGDASRR